MVVVKAVRNNYISLQEHLSTWMLKSHKTGVLVNIILNFPNKPIEIFKIMPYNKCIFTENFRFLFFVLILPCIQMMNVCVTVGNDPTDLEVGVVNFDSDCKNYSMEDCSAEHLSCRFLDLLPAQNSINRTLKLVIIMEFCFVLSSMWTKRTYSRNSQGCFEIKSIIRVIPRGKLKNSFTYTLT